MGASVFTTLVFALAFPLVVVGQLIVPEQRSPQAVTAASNTDTDQHTYKPSMTAESASETQDKKSGCWRDGKWYPEGATIDVPKWSRLAVGGYTICRNGKWVFIAK